MQVVPFRSLGLNVDFEFFDEVHDQVIFGTLLIGPFATEEDRGTWVTWLQDKLVEELHPWLAVISTRPLHYTRSTVACIPKYFEAFPRQVLGNLVEISIEAGRIERLPEFTSLHPFP